MRRIVIVGGGTAGWMSAITISSRIRDVSVAVIDPVNIPSIGVGESVTGSVQQFVSDPAHQLSMSDFFRNTDATYKYGIWYRDWMGPGTNYLTPIDVPTQYFRGDFFPSETEEFFALAAADNIKLGDAMVFAHLMKANRTDLLRDSNGQIDSRFSQPSCQFDAVKFAQWLREDASNRERIEHLDAVVDSVQQDPETGFIESVTTSDGRVVSGDFFLDCSGFRRLLLGQLYSPTWNDYSQYIKINRAIPCPIPYREGEDIPVFTTAAAMKHGWSWTVPTQSRLGRGYVYSSKYTDDATALDELRQTGVDPGDSPRIIKFDPGKYEQQWVKNVCAIGLAGGFLEPLEATTIHIMTVQSRLLADVYLPAYSPAAASSLSRNFNRLINAAYEDYIDFITFHYHTGRDDTEFWRDYQQPESITPRNRERMEKWQYAFPAREDFSPVYTHRTFLTTGLAVWMPMLCAMGYCKPETAQHVIRASSNPDKTRQNVAEYIKTRNMIVQNGISHREAIDWSCQSGE